MKCVPLLNSPGEFAKVDDEDFPSVNLYKWFKTPKGYAATEADDGSIFYMHHLVVALASEKNAKNN